MKGGHFFQKKYVPLPPAVRKWSVPVETFPSSSDTERRSTYGEFMLRMCEGPQTQNSASPLCPHFITAVQLHVASSLGPLWTDTPC